MTRWAMLAHVADVNRAWTADQSRLAFDLLGTPVEFREGHKPGASLDLDGRLIESADDPAAVARREIAALKQRRELVEGLDEVKQALAVADLDDEDDPELRRLRRYESALHRRLRWCLAQLRYESPHSGPPRPRAPEVGRPAGGRAPSPPRPAGAGDAGGVLAGEDAQPAVRPGAGRDPRAGRGGRHPEDRLRLDARRSVRKAEARRESRRRKLERLRA